jgi:hypothetical protein
MGQVPGRFQAHQGAGVGYENVGRAEFLKLASGK